MSERIFRYETNAREEWLDVNDDETVTYHIENSGWPMMKAGIGGSDKTFTIEEAKKKWSAHAAAIDKALVKIRADRPKVKK
jgi:hypothetical protein